MRKLLVCCLVLCSGSFVFSGEVKKEKKFERFFAWSLPAKAEDIRRAAEMGVTDGVMHKPTPRMLETAGKYGINVYLCLTPRAKHLPAQELLPDEQRLLEAYGDGKKLYGTGHAFGGEPLPGAKREILPGSRLLCLNRPEVREWMKSEIRRLAATPGIAGIAFDFVGFRNYHGCYCAVCRKDLAAFLKKNPGKSEKDFFLRQLVDFNNDNVAFMKSLNPKLKSFAHLYPVFLPEPLYGKRLKFDYCAETVAWYIAWPDEKIRSYTAAVASYPGGVPFIGYYDHKRTVMFPEKTPERVEHELRLILDAGGRSLCVCGFAHVLKNDAVREIFKKYLRPRQLPAPVSEKRGK